MIGRSPAIQVIDGGGAGGGGAVHSTHSLSFDGTGWVDVGNSGTLNPTAGMTIACWVNNGTTPSGNAWFVGRDDNAAGRSYAFGIGNNNNLALQINGSNVLGGHAGDIANGSWYHVAVTGDPGTGWIGYINGVQADSAAWTAPASSTAHTNIGRRSFSGFQGNVTGLIDDVRIYGRALSAAEIANLYAGQDLTGTAGYWPLEEGSGTSTADNSGNGDNGTLNGGVTWSTSHPTQLN